VAELMRLLVDEHGFAWAAAWAITQKVFSYTNHTLMPEALETWPVALMQHVLPRHLEIIFRINHEFLLKRQAHRPGDNDFLRRLSLIDEARRAPRAHGPPVHRGQPQGQRRVGAALEPAGQTIFADFAACGPSASPT
jgi:starch phosphorylase